MPEHTSDKHEWLNEWWDQEFLDPSLSGYMFIGIDFRGFLKIMNYRKRGVWRALEKQHPRHRFEHARAYATRIHKLVVTQRNLAIRTSRRLPIAELKLACVYRCENLTQQQYLDDYLTHLVSVWRTLFGRGYTLPPLDDFLCRVAKKCNP